MNIQYLEQNNTSYPYIVKENLSKILYNKDEEFLTYYQYLPFKFMETNLKCRGLLIYMDTGYGKTFIAVSIADYFRRVFNKRIIIVSSKNLVNNFIKSIFFYLKKNHSHEEIEEIIKKKFIFTTINSVKKIINKEGLEDSLLIIDEAHNIFNSITNSSYNAIYLYNNVMKTKKLKLLFLTGTPIINHPFELAPCFNMLKGKVILPENYNDFINYFIDERTSNLKIKNPSIFSNRIFGLVSYYGNIYDKDNFKKKKFFPIEKPIKIEKVKMSDNQYSIYAVFRKVEKDETLKKYSNKRIVEKWKSSNTSGSYRVKTRMASNFAFPSNRKIEKIDLTEQLHIYSPKIKRMLENIKSHGDDALGLIYSSFISLRGLKIIQKVLEVNGYEYYKTAKSNKKKYSILTGEVPLEERVNTINIFTKSENKYGKLIHLLLISSIGAEGLDLKNVQHVHILEPYWNFSRIKQIIARAVRYKSHLDLPIDKRTVTPYIYLSDYPNIGAKDRMKEQLTTDVQLWENSFKMYKLIKGFERLLISSSIDCFSHNDEVTTKIKCKICVPTNEPLYHDSLHYKKFLINNCKENIDIIKDSDEMKQVIVDGNTFYYLKNQEDVYEIFVEDKDLGIYKQLMYDDLRYDILYEKIMDKEEKVVYGGGDDMFFEKFHHTRIISYNPITKL